MISSPRIISLAKYAAALIVIGAVIYAILPGLREGASLWPRLNHCRWEWIVAAAICQIGVYCCLAGILSAALVSMGHRITAPTLLYTAFAFLFATRSFAVIGLAVLVMLLGRRGVPADRAHATAGVFYLADYVGFFVLIGLVFVDAGSFVQSPRVLFFGVGLIVVLALCASGAYRFPKRVAAIAEAAFLRGASAAGHAAPEDVSRRASDFVLSLHARWVELTARRTALVVASFWALVMHLFESGTLYCLSRSFGTTVSGPAAAAAYLAGNLAALVSFLPGGLGIFEGAMAATLHRFGHSPLGVAILTTLAYRAISVWLPMPAVIGVVREVAVRRRVSGGNSGQD